MKLRRAMVTAAATAVIAPLALLSAPSAFAEDAPSTPPSSSSSESAPESAPESTPESTPPTSEPESTPPTSAPESTPSQTAPSPSSSESSTTAPSPSESATETPEPEPSDCKDSKVDISINGLPGKIAAGSGWHKFSLNVWNTSDSTLNDLAFFAGTSADKNGDEVFKSKQVRLQAWNPDDKVWEDLNTAGYAWGYVGYTDTLEPDYEVDIPLRINVKKSAPVGAGFSLGMTVYGDGDGECMGFGDVSYKFQIVSAGTDTEGTKPQEGGKAPVTDTKPDSTTPKVEGSLAETGSSSALPMIGLVGGAAVVAGAGAMVLVRRRKAGASA